MMRYARKKVLTLMACSWLKNLQISDCFLVSKVNLIKCRCAEPSTKASSTLPIESVSLDMAQLQAALRPSSSTVTPPQPLLNVSPGIHLNIMDHLDVLDLAALKLTSHYFYEIIPRLGMKELALAQALDYKDRHIPYWMTFLPCRTCTRLLPGSKFTDTQLNNHPCLTRSAHHDLIYHSHSRPSPLPPSSGRRFCIECGIKAGANCGYQKGDSIQVNGQRLVICFHCGKAGQYTKTEDVESYLFCNDCYKQRQPGKGRFKLRPRSKRPLWS